MTPVTGIVTPEAVVLEFRAAGLATRAMAKAVDLLLMMVFAWVVGLVATLIAIGWETGGVVFGVVGTFLGILILPAAIESMRDGVTPGKSMLGLRVVTTEGGPVSFRHALIRGFFQLVEIPTGIALFVSVLNPKSQRLGDLAAGTFVVNNRSILDHANAIAFLPPPGLEAFCHSLDTSAVNSEQFLVIRNFLLRVGEVTADARYAIAVRLGSSLREMCATTVPPGVTAEMFLICVASSYQIHHGGLPTADQINFGPLGLPPEVLRRGRKNRGQR